MIELNYERLIIEKESTKDRKFKKNKFYTGFNCSLKNFLLLEIQYNSNDEIIRFIFYNKKRWITEPFKTIGDLFFIGVLSFKDFVNIMAKVVIENGY